MIDVVLLIGKIAVESIRSPVGPSTVPLPSNVRAIRDARRERSSVRELEVQIVSPKFKLVFLSILSLTVMAGVLSVLLVLFPQNQPGQEFRGVLESMNTTWKMGLGAIFGLLGSKAV